MKRTVEELHARGIQCAYGTVRAIVTGKQDGRAGRETKQRFAPVNILEKAARLPAIDSVAMRDLRTMFPHTVVPAGAADVLKSGFNSPKIGATILKGRWRGMPVYTLTLEERATCPVSCRHLRSCMGNKMGNYILDSLCRWCGSLPEDEYPLGGQPCRPRCPSSTKIPGSTPPRQHLSQFLIAPCVRGWF